MDKPLHISFKSHRDISKWDTIKQGRLLHRILYFCIKPQAAFVFKWPIYLRRKIDVGLSQERYSSIFSSGFPGLTESYQSRYLPIAMKKSSSKTSSAPSSTRRQDSRISKPPSACVGQRTPECMDAQSASTYKPKISSEVSLESGATRRQPATLKPKERKANRVEVKGSSSNVQNGSNADEIMFKRTRDDIQNHLEFDRRVEQNLIDLRERANVTSMRLYTQTLERDETGDRNRRSHNRWPAS